MTEMKKTLESSLKVRFHDCDPFNHLNNSRYIDYIMAARSEQLEEAYALDIYKLAREEGVSWVSAQTQISYLSPAFLGEEVKVQTRLLSFTDKSLLVEGVMFSKDHTIIKAIMWAKLVHFNLQTQKSHPHSTSLIHFFNQVVHPLPSEISFNERVKILKDKNFNAVS